MLSLRRIARVPHKPLDHRHTDFRVLASNLGSEVHGFLEHLLLRNHAVEELGEKGVGCEVHAAGHHEVQGARAADELGLVKELVCFSVGVPTIPTHKEPGARGLGSDTTTGKDESDLGGFGNDTEIHRQGLKDRVR
jgi:hypothetical protein